jgi:NAD(P)-dependent dehydrogenase (short-subunit alcohol dehydrogenase family)
MERVLTRRCPPSRSLVVASPSAFAVQVADIQNLIDTAVKEFGRIDCLINNAGWHPPPKSIDEFSIEDMQDLFQLNFISYFAACKFALPHIRKVQGNIINMGSWVAINGQVC